MTMKAAIIIVRLTCFYFVFDVCRCSSPRGPIDSWNDTNVRANNYTYDVVNTRLNQLGNHNWLRRITKVTIIRRCCINNECRVLRNEEKCEPSVNFTNVQNITQRPIIRPLVDKSSEKPKNKPSNHVTTVGFNGDKAAQIRYQVLSRSNFYRQKYGVSPLVLDEKINSIAQDWANRLAITGQRRHRQPNSYGENIYFTTDLDDLGEKSVDSWFKEIVQFNKRDDETKLFANSATHHMTQLLWKSSSKLGVGVAKNPNIMYKYIVVANYNPPGNVYGHFKSNLPRLM